MSTLVVARGQRPIDAVLAVLRGNGYEAVGTTADDEALTRIEAGGVTVLVVGGGVERASRERLKQTAATHHTTVVEGALAGCDVETYVRHDLEPRLRKSAGLA